MNVLVIDDNEQNRYLLRFLLEARGHRVTRRLTDPRASRRCTAEVPDLVLLDIQLPGMDGYAVARTLRTDPLLMPCPLLR